MDFTLSEELTMVRDMARDFVANELLPIERTLLVRDQSGTRGAPMPAESRSKLKKMAVEQGLWAMAAPEELGGGGLSVLGMCLVAEELGKTFVDFDFGDIPPLLFQANDEQREQYLASAIAGEKECALAVRELGEAKPGELKTTAVLEGDAWVLTGNKAVEETPADFYLVLAATEQGPTWFIVDQVRAQDGQLALDHARVSTANVLGQVGRALALGKAYKSVRQVQTAARRIGMACRLLELASQYARDWKSLGQPLMVRPAVQRWLAEMAIDIDAGRWLVYRAACAIDEMASASGGVAKLAEISTQAKQDVLRASLFAAEMVERVGDRTVQVYGGPAFAADLPMLHLYGTRMDRMINKDWLALQRFQIANQLVNA